jgi:molybdopterin synthase sulfur carrier subunit
MTTLRYWAAARAAAGRNEDAVDASTLTEALARARDAHGPELARVVDVCSFLVDGEPVGGRDHDTVALGPDTVVDVLPPFAGG